MPRLVTVNLICLPIVTAEEMANRLQKAIKKMEA